MWYIATGWRSKVWHRPKSWKRRTVACGQRGKFAVRCDSLDVAFENMCKRCWRPLRGKKLIARIRVELATARARGASRTDVARLETDLTKAGGEP